MKKFASGAMQFAQFMNTDQQLLPLQQQAEAILRLERIWQRIVPAPLGAGTQLGPVKGGILPVYCVNAAIAGKLRQLTGRISQALAAENLPLALHIKVRIEQTAPQQREIPPRHMPDHALHQLRQLHADLPEGELKAALTQLLKKH